MPRRTIPIIPLPSAKKLIAQWRARPVEPGTLRVRLPVSYGTRARTLIPPRAS